MMVRYGRLGAGGVPNARLDRSEALRYLGYTGQQVDEALLTRFNRLADECERVIAPSFAWSVFGIDEKRTCWEAPEPAATGSLDALDASIPFFPISKRLVTATNLIILCFFIILNVFS